MSGINFCGLTDEAGNDEAADARIDLSPQENDFSVIICKSYLPEPSKLLLVFTREILRASLVAVRTHITHTRLLEFRLTTCYRPA